MEVTNLIFGPKIFLRAASRSFQNFNYQELKSLIKDKVFLLSIYFASEDLFNELQKKDFDYDQLSERTILSLRRYYNRNCFRATPFGLFSSVSAVTWTNQAEAILAAKEYKVSLIPDFEILKKIGSCISDPDNELFKYKPNSTIYAVNDGSRFLKYDIDDDREHSAFKIYAFDNSLFLKKIFAYCGPGKTKKQLVKFCLDAAGDETEAVAFIENLINTGILLSESAPHYVGNSYFEKLKILTQNKNLEERYSAFWEKIKACSVASKIHDLDISLLTELTPPFKDKVFKNKFYINQSLKINSGVPDKYQLDLVNCLKCLQKLTLSRANPSLDSFKKSFKARYDRQDVGLLQALDPEIGINYLRLDREIEENILLQSLDFKEKCESAQFEWTNIHQLFLNKWHRTKDARHIIIEEEDFKNLAVCHDQALPPSFSVSFIVNDEQLFIEHVGGCSASTLAARFTLFDSELHEYAKYIAEKEQEINNQVIFAEISCPINNHISNVNTRKHLYRYEIPLITPSEIDPTYRIETTDLFVRLSGNDIVLFSKKLNKVVIPRFSSAYNYHLHDLPLFRFLCDLQHQGLKTDLTLNLVNLFPGLDHYPRVTFKDCVLFRETWVLNADALAIIKKSIPMGDLCGLFFDDLKIPDKFTFTEGDNSLFIDRTCPIAMSVFSHAIKGKSSAIIRESHIGERSLLTDSHKRPIINEMVAAVINLSPSIGFPELIHSKSTRSAITRKFQLADRWLYFKVYVHPNTADLLIGTALHKFVKLLAKEKLIDHWFFIRYSDPENHLRIRIRLNNNEAGKAIRIFNLIFKHEGIANALLDSYDREIERYGFSNIYGVEKIFFYSSLFAVKFYVLLAKKKVSYSCSDVCIMSVDALISLFYADNSSKEKFAAKMALSMMKEFNPDNILKRQLDDKYRKMRPLIVEYLEPERRNTVLKQLGIRALSSAIKEVIGKFDKHAKEKLFADIIHMHLNRMLKKEQRKQEFTIYYLLQKYYLAIHKRAKPVSPSS